MEGSVETSVESGRSGRGASVPVLDLQLLGPFTIRQGGRALALPPSRKVRALVAYLALAQRPLTRAHLSELLWDVPNDPRGELRWCLSKIRAVLGESDRHRIESVGDTVHLDLSDCFVDAARIERALQAGIDTFDAQALRALAALFTGEFLGGLKVGRSEHFNGWLLAQRRRLRACHTALLERLVTTLPSASDESLGHLQTWLELAPFDRRAHALLLSALGERGRIRDGEEHLAAAAQLFEAEGLDWRPLGASWASAKTRQSAALPPAAMVGATPVVPAEPLSDISGPHAHRASLAVMPFADLPSNGDDRGKLSDGFAHDIITRLAKLRSLFVIAQGTVFALGARNIGAQEAARTLNVDYVASGSIRRRGGRVIVDVELAETRSARIVWAETFDEPMDDALAVIDEIGNRIVASIAGEVEAAERNRAILKAPNSLDAWEAHHCGLWHMYRFNRADNERAREYFEMAVRLDPTFSRAFAGLSFTHWQNAFQGWVPARSQEVDRAFDAAGQSLLADDRDPAAHWAMGRALWLRGQQDPLLVELQTAVDLSPNFALGHYTLAFVHSQSGDPNAAIESSDHSRLLSPFDPLLFGMLGARAMALVRLGQFEEAANWALKAAARPNAHVHILAIAAQCLAMAGRQQEARGFVAMVRKKVPAYRVDDFLGAFHFADDAAALWRRAAKGIGFA